MLECLNITKSYKRGGLFSSAVANIALNDINFTLTAGRSMGLLGDNGSGKSTLTRIILGLERPDSGCVIFDGNDVHKMVKTGDRSFRRHMQAVFQDPASAMNPRWSALRTITEPLINYGSYDKAELREKAAALMKSVNMKPEELDKNVLEFSGGQQQRLCIARALALSPRLLILDEALSNLDMIVQAQIVELLMELKRSCDISLLLISHDSRVVFKLCEDITEISAGRVTKRLRIEYSI